MTRPPAAEVPYVPPRPTLVPCPDCGELILRGPRGAALTPCFGLPHDCVPGLAAPRPEENEVGPASHD